MNPVPVLNLVFEKLEKYDLNGIRGSFLLFVIPIYENPLNTIIASVISDSEEMSDFKSIHISNLDEEEFIIRVEHQKINKTLRCRLHNITYNNDSEPILIIEFIEGIRFYEKIALLSASTYKKGLKWFKSKFQVDDEDTFKSRSAFDISSSHLTINLAELLRKLKLNFLNKLITWKEISAKGNKLIIEFYIKT